MKLNFSSISADPERMLSSFNGYCGIEFEGFSIAKRGSTEAEVEQLKTEARKQLRQYASSIRIQHDKGTTELIAIALVFRGWKLESFEKIV